MICPTLKSFFSEASINANGRGVVLPSKVLYCFPCKMVFIADVISRELVDFTRDIVSLSIWIRIIELFLCGVTFQFLGIVMDLYGKQRKLT